jgi:hypothetical protein
MRRKLTTQSTKRSPLHRDLVEQVDSIRGKTARLQSTSSVGQVRTRLKQDWLRPVKVVQAKLYHPRPRRKIRSHRIHKP